MMHGPFSLIPRLFSSYLEKHSYFQAPKPACHRSEKMRTRLRTFIMASFTKLTWENKTHQLSGYSEQTQETCMNKWCEKRIEWLNRQIFLIHIVRWFEELLQS